MGSPPAAATTKMSVGPDCEWLYAKKPPSGDQLPATSTPTDPVMGRVVTLSARSGAGLRTNRKYDATNATTATPAATGAHGLRRPGGSRFSELRDIDALTDCSMSPDSTSFWSPSSSLHTSRAVWKRFSGFFSRQRLITRPRWRGRFSRSSVTEAGFSLRMEDTVEIGVSPLKGRMPVAIS